tara:strand:- start:4720 stop:5070 length:351 start_codon:yes stop_codon:yes gene_type:complete
MAISRYNERQIITTNDSQYRLSSLFKKRGIKSVDHFSTPELTYLTSENYLDIIEITQVWGVGSKYFKLAKEFYDDEQYWWVIAWYNLKPLETDFSVGDIVYIPTPLEEILSIYEVI